MSSTKTIIVTGGAGFIGSHVVRRFVTNYPDYQILNLDTLTYAGNLENLRDIEEAPNYHFEKADICNSEAIDALFKKYRPDAVIHLAAESHVDRSILDPLAFIKTNIEGTVNLLNAFKGLWMNDFDGNGYVDKVLTKPQNGKDMPIMLKKDLADQWWGDLNKSVRLLHLALKTEV